MPLLATPLRSGALLLLGGFLGLLLLVGCGDDPVGPDLEADTLFNLVVDSEDLTMLEDLVRETDLESLLRGSAEYTFFAPTDFALERLGSDLVGQLRSPANRDILFKILRRHLVPGRISFEALQDGTTLTPLEGPPLEVRVVDGRTYVGGAPITLRRADFETGNGVVHYVDDVVRDHLTLQERLRITPSFSVFATMLNQAGLGSLANGNQPYTLLIPISDAFSQLEGTDLPTLSRFDNRSILIKVLRHHVLPGRVRLEDLENTDTLTPLGGLPLSVEHVGGTLYLGGSRVIAAEVETADGLIYLLSDVILTHLNLADRVQLNRNLTVVAAILEAAGLADQLRTSSDLTLFAPTDGTFEYLGENFLAELNERSDLLLRTAQSFLVPGRIEREDLLQGGVLTTLGGHELPVTVGVNDGPDDVFLNATSRVFFPPVRASNGLLYTVSPLLVPPTDLEGKALFAGLYRFLRLVARAGLLPLLEGEAEYTIFAPTDDDALTIANLPESELADVLRRHIVEGRYSREDLPSGTVLKSIAGTSIEIVVDQSGPGGGFFANGVRYSGFDVSAENGALYTLEGILP